MPAVSLVSKLDRLLGDGFISFMRDPINETFTVSARATTLAGAGFKPAGWNYVMNARYMVRTMPEKDWGPYLAEILTENGY